MEQITTQNEFENKIADIYLQIESLTKEIDETYSNFFGDFEIVDYNVRKKIILKIYRGYIREASDYNQILRGRSLKKYLEENQKLKNKYFNN